MGLGFVFGLIKGLGLGLVLRFGLVLGVGLGLVSITDLTNSTAFYWYYKNSKMLQWVAGLEIYSTFYFFINFLTTTPIIYMLV